MVVNWAVMKESPKVGVKAHSRAGMMAASWAENWAELKAG